MTENTTLEKQISSIWQSIKGFHIVHFINTGSELNLFITIRSYGEKGIHPEVLAKKLDLNYNYINKWCNSGVAWQILDVLGNDNIMLADEITCDSQRIWTKDGQSLDKDVFRQGDNMQDVEDVYNYIHTLISADEIKEK